MVALTDVSWRPSKCVSSEIASTKPVIKSAFAKNAHYSGVLRRDGAWIEIGNSFMCLFSGKDKTRTPDCTQAKSRIDRLPWFTERDYVNSLSVALIGGPASQWTRRCQWLMGRGANGNAQNRHDKKWVGLFFSKCDEHTAGFLPTAPRTTATAPQHRVTAQSAV